MSTSSATRNANFCETSKRSTRTQKTQRTQLKSSFLTQTKVNKEFQISKGFVHSSQNEYIFNWGQETMRQRSVRGTGNWLHFSACLGSLTGIKTRLILFRRVLPVWTAVQPDGLTFRNTSATAKLPFAWANCGSMQSRQTLCFERRAKVELQSRTKQVCGALSYTSGLIICWQSFRIFSPTCYNSAFIIPHFQWNKTMRRDFPECWPRPTLRPRGVATYTWRPRLKVFETWAANATDLSCLITNHTI